MYLVGKCRASKCSLATWSETLANKSDSSIGDGSQHRTKFEAMHSSEPHLALVFSGSSVCIREVSGSKVPDSNNVTHKSYYWIVGCKLREIKPRGSIHPMWAKEIGISLENRSRKSFVNFVKWSYPLEPKDTEITGVDFDKSLLMPRVSNKDSEYCFLYREFDEPYDLFVHGSCAAFVDHCMTISDGRLRVIETLYSEIRGDCLEERKNLIRACIRLSQMNLDYADCLEIADLEAIERELANARKKFLKSLYPRIRAAQVDEPRIFEKLQLDIVEKTGDYSALASKLDGNKEWFAKLTIALDNHKKLPKHLMIRTELLRNWVRLRYFQAPDSKLYSIFQNRGLATGISYDAFRGELNKLELRKYETDRGYPHLG